MDVDHIVAVAGPADPLFWKTENHQALCGTCHKRKTALENGGFGMSDTNFGSPDSTTITLPGGAGNDTMPTSGGTSITLYGGAGNDTLATGYGGENPYSP